MVGSKLDDVQGENAGAVAIYRFSDSAKIWEKWAMLSPPDLQPGDRFGTAVSLQLPWVLIGASESDGKIENSGSVHVFALAENSNTFVWHSTLRPTTEVLGEKFGVEIDIFDDTVFIGASAWAQTDTATGSVSVFELEGNQWQLSHQLRPEDLELGDMFGFRVVAHKNELAIGAHFSRVTNTDRAGVVYRYSKINGRWHSTERVFLKDGREDDRFGIALALGSQGLIIGAEKADASGTDSGAIFFYDTN